MSAQHCWGLTCLHPGKQNMQIDGFWISSCYSEKWGGELVHPVAETLKAPVGFVNCFLQTHGWCGWIWGVGTQGCSLPQFSSWAKPWPPLCLPAGPGGSSHSLALIFMKLSLLCIHPRFNTSPAVPWASVSFVITRPEEMIWVSIITCLYARAGHYPHCLLMAVSWLNVNQLWGFPTQMFSSRFRFFSWTKPQFTLITLTPSLSHVWTDPKASQDLRVLQQLLWKREIKKVSQTTEAFPVSHFHLFIHPTTAISYLTAGKRNF